MAAEINQHFVARCELIAGSKGIFDVTVNGKLIFSKYQDHRFPDHGEITQLINAHPEIVS